MLPSNAPWLGTIFRGFHPLRWLLCVAGLSITLLALAFSEHLFLGRELEINQWFVSLSTRWTEWTWEIAHLSFGRVVFISLVLFTVLGTIWGLIGMWITRRELFALFREGTKPQTSATQLLLRRCFQFFGGIFCCQVFMLMMLFPGLIGGLFSLHGFLAILLAIFAIPIILIFALMFSLLAGGFLFGYWVMPAAMGTEGSSIFDALSRGLSYFYQKMPIYILFVGLSLGFALVPVLLLQAFPFQVEDFWFLPVMGLSLSIFWSLQTRVYLRLRRIQDKTPEDVFWDGDNALLKPRGEQSEKHIVEVTAQDWSEKVEYAKKPVLVLCWASWCPFSQQQANVFSRLPSHFDERVGLATINLDENPEIGEKLQITSLPKTYLYKDSGTPLQELDGLVSEIEYHRVLAGVAPTGPSPGEPPAPLTVPQGKKSWFAIRVGSLSEPDSPSERLSLKDTFGAPAISFFFPNLLLGIGWTFLILFAAAWISWRYTGGGNVSYRDAVWRLYGQQPAIFVALVTTSLVLIAFGLRRLLKACARTIAIQQVFRIKLKAKTAHLFGAIRGRVGWTSTLLMTVGVTAFCIAGYLLPSTLMGGVSWQEPLACAVAAFVFLIPGSFGLAGLGIESSRSEKIPSSVGMFFQSLMPLVGSAVINLAICLLHLMFLGGLLFLTWFVICESITWFGGPNTQWIRWGLDGRFFPTPENGLYRVASAIVGIWFFLLVGTVMVYPLGYFIRWGVICYFWARQELENIPAGIDIDDQLKEEIEALKKKEHIFSTENKSTWPCEKSYVYLGIHRWAKEFRSDANEKQAKAERLAAFLEKPPDNCEDLLQQLEAQMESELLMEENSPELKRESILTDLQILHLELKR